MTYVRMALHNDTRHSSISKVMGYQSKHIKSYFILSRFGSKIVLDFACSLNVAYN